MEQELRMALAWALEAKSRVEFDEQEIEYENKYGGGYHTDFSSTRHALKMVERALERAGAAFRTRGSLPVGLPAPYED
jgi:hypothetical protein